MSIQEAKRDSDKPPTGQLEFQTSQEIFLCSTERNGPVAHQASYLMSAGVKTTRG
jgi:hypothetical protein